MGKLILLPNLSAEALENQLVTIGDLEKFREKLLLDLKLLIATNSLQSTKRWLKSNEVRKMLKISPGTLQTFRDNGTIPYSKMNGIFYYDSVAIDELMTKQQVNKVANLTDFKSAA